MKTKRAIWTFTVLNTGEVKLLNRHAVDDFFNRRVSWPFPDETEAHVADVLVQHEPRGRVTVQDVWLTRRELDAHRFLDEAHHRRVVRQIAAHLGKKAPRRRPRLETDWNPTDAEMYALRDAVLHMCSTWDTLGTWPR